MSWQREPAILDIKIKQGVDWWLPLTLKKADGSTEDTGGYTAILKIRPAYGATPVVALTETSGITLGIDPTNGTNVTAYLGAAMTTKLEPWGQGVYDLFLTDSFDHWRCVIKGGAMLEEGASVP